MADAVKDFFANLESQADATKTAGMSNSYVFDIDGAGQWKVDVDDGKVTVTEGGGDADVTISTSQETFEKIVAGEVNPTSAYMTGKLKIVSTNGVLSSMQMVKNGGQNADIASNRYRFGAGSDALGDDAIERIDTARRENELRL